MQDTEELMTVSELREKLRLSKSAVYSLIGREIPGYYLLDRAVRVKTSDVDRWLASKRYLSDYRDAAELTQGEGLDQVEQEDGE